MEKGYTLVEVKYEIYEDDGETSAEIVSGSESIEEFTLDPTDWDDEPSDHAEVRLLAKLLRYDGILEPNSSHMGPGDWFMRKDEDFRTGGWTEVSVHPKGFSKSEWTLLGSLLFQRRRTTYSVVYEMERGEAFPTLADAVAEAYIAGDGRWIEDSDGNRYGLDGSI